MPEAGAVATLRLSNATAAPLFIWLEPWVDELWLPPRSELTLHTVTLGELQWPEIEANDDEGLTIWGVGGSTLRVEIDNVPQDTFSAGYASPDLGALSPKFFVNTVFGAFPQARPGGHPLQPVRRRGWLSRLLGR
ncbi:MULTISPECIES: hypothetical protein [unclassified Sphingomonas]|jgi:hypothetical protein|nr:MULTISPECIES: hypothetical protein [unclassified Sphingomonas]